MARAKTATVQLKVRMREELRARLEKAAKSRELTLNAEIVDRLNGSFSKETFAEAAFGGPELQNIALLMAAAFATGGQASAGDRKPEEWTRQPTAYTSGMVSVIRALMVGLPCADDRARARDAIASWILTEKAQENFDGSR